MKDACNNFKIKIFPLHKNEKLIVLKRIKPVTKCLAFSLYDIAKIWQYQLLENLTIKS